MLRSTWAFIVVSVLGIAIGARPLDAEPIDVTISVTSGTVSFQPQNGEGTGFQLFGSDGFSFVAQNESGVTAPRCCLAPGATTSIRAFWSDNDLLGTITYNGQTFPNVGGLTSSSTATVDFRSSPFTLPSFTGSTPLTVMAPVTLNGTFSGAPTTGHAPPTVNATLVGSGVGTVLFSWFAGIPGQPGSNVWQPTSATIQMSGNGDVVPEPSSILLVCLSLVAGYLATRYRGAVPQ